MSHSPTLFAPPDSARLLLELESRQDEVLRELDELNARIERAIAMGQLGVRPAADTPRPAEAA